MAPGRAGLQSRAQEVSLSLRQLSPACCGRRLPRRRQSPARSRRAVGCMSSSRLYSPPPPAPRPRRPPRSQLSRSRHANFWLGTKGSARAGRGRALLPLAAQPAHPPLAASAGLAGGSPPPSPRRRAAPPRPGSPPGSPGARRGEPRGGWWRRSRGGGREKERPEWRGRGRRRGLEAEAAEAGLPHGSGLSSPSASSSAHQTHAHRAPGPEGEPRPPERARGGGRHPREARPRRANPLTKESPALLPLARPPAAPAASGPSGLRAQPKGERT